MITFHCPGCQQKISAEANQAGATGLCPTCGAEFLVPEYSAYAANEQVVAMAAGVEPEPANETIDGPTRSEPVHEHETGPSLADRLKEGAKEGWSGVKRHSKQAALRAQAEKLRTVDLRKAHHSLGKKCYESGLLADALGEQVQAIRDLDKRITEKREKGEAESDETKMATLKRKGMDAAKASHAQALTVKREHLITELGRLAYPNREKGNLPGLEAEVERICVIEGQILGKEQEIENLGGKPAKAGKPKVMIAAAALIIIVTVGSIWDLRLLGNDKNDPRSMSDNRGKSRAEEQFLQAQSESSRPA
jgi:hypothetical protein